MSIRKKVKDSLESERAANMLLDILYGKDKVSDSFEFLDDGESTYKVDTVSGDCITVEDQNGVPFVVPKEDITYTGGDTATVGYYLKDSKLPLQKIGFLRKLHDNGVYCNLLKGKPLTVKVKDSTSGKLFKCNYDGKTVVVDGTALSLWSELKKL